MKLIVTEKNDAAKQIAGLLGSKKPTSDKVFSTPVYRFDYKGEECISIGLRGHIMAVDFVPELKYKTRTGWSGVTAEGDLIRAVVPDSLARPPFKKRKPFTTDGVEFKGWKMDSLPYLVYAPVEKLPKEKDIIRSLKNLAKKADSVVIATDFDREGELIGSDALRCVRDVNPSIPVSRARYSAFTKEEITTSFNNLVDMDMNLADAGASRRDIDLIWGAAVTRFLTVVKFSGYGNVRSSGRVQTPTLGLIVARERERMAFVPEDYWVIKGSFGAGSDAFEATHKTDKFKSIDAANEVMAHVEGQRQAVVSDIESKTRTQMPPAPFNTTALQIAASSEGISPSRAMKIAENLYMRGLISYPRVDNTVYPSSLDLGATVRMLNANPAYAEACSSILSGPIKATRGKIEDTDHPPIYPTGLATSDDLSGADWKIYNLVARRFLATLMGKATFEDTKATLSVDGEPFVAKGAVLKDAGFRSIYPFGMSKDKQLPVLSKDQIIDFNGATLTAKQTEPPARYSQAQLIKEMEKLGLGTKSTRAGIIDRLYAVKYIQNDPIEPSQLGIAVIGALDQFAPHITHSQMTAELEQEMLEIGKGQRTYADVVSDSRDKLAAELAALIPHAEDVKAALGDAVAADAYIGTCPKCGRDLQIRTSSKTRSSFIGCSGWPECDVTYPVPQGKLEATQETCAECGLPKIKITPFRSKAKVICVDPDCTSNKVADVFVGVCPVCAQAGKTSKMHAHVNPRTLKRYIRCENYDECGNGYPLPPNGEITALDRSCDDCGAPMVTITTARGPWTLCPNFNCPGKAAEQASKPAKRKTRGSSKSKRTKSTKSK